ncbi:hypothetical protein AWR27_02265 [Spirosoma montaniterrae]|uniref:HTH cro/C1-type domain-containing protein n=2 Tax=Spirosoma montaniterrae TaxID=1178516 RepID=A0A1P9WSC3_9BACT|nr:hypothetical protein AWR27_02265 [Spirosoma montaniterrae]
MAFKMNISQTAYSYLENKDEDKLAIRELRKIASIFEISLTDLIANLTDSEPTSIMKTDLTTSALNFVQKINKNDTYKQSICASVKQIREIQGITQQIMADRMGVSLKTYRLLENQPDDLFKLGRIKQIAIVLSVPHWSVLIPEDNAELMIL